MSINARLKEVRKMLQMQQKEFAKKLGISKTSYCSIETGKAVLADRNIGLVCEVFNVNELWLRFGEGSAFKLPLSAARGEEEMLILSLFRKLSAEMKIVVLQKMKEFLAMDAPLTTPQPEPPVKLLGFSNSFEKNKQQEA